MGMRPKTTKKQRILSTMISRDVWNSRDFSLEDKIGQGHFGQVYRASYKTSENKTKDPTTVVALKRFSKEKIAESKDRGSRAHELLQREVQIHSQ